MNAFNATGYFFALLCGLFFLTACGSDQQNSIRQGKTKIAVDETFQPIIETELKAYRQQNPKADIEVIYTNEAEAMRLFLTDSAQLVLVPRKLSEAETKTVFNQIQITPRSTWFAVDGIVVIVNKGQGKDTTFTLSRGQLKDVLTGKIKKWDEIGGSNEPIQVVFDQNNSSLVHYATDSIVQGQKMASNIFAAKSNPGVIEYVINNKNALGIIGFNWLSSTSDSTVQLWQQYIKQVGIINPDNNKAYDLTNDVIYNLTHDRYPLKRNIYIHNRETSSVGLATGLSAFLAGKEGQLIAHKANLIPSSGMVRLVEVREEKKPEIVKD